MKLQELEKRPETTKDKKLAKISAKFEKLISELNKKEIPEEIVNSINQNVKEINNFTGSDKALRKLVRKTQWNILKLVEKELKLVPKNVYRARWLAIGMTVFGVPLGVAFGTSLGNMGFLGIGLPIGMVIGMAIGVGMDKKALAEGRQLDLDQ
jgi:hypothetical protein